MSGDFIKFWRYIQRFALGAFASLEIVILIFESNRIMSMVNLIFTSKNNFIGLLNFSIIFILIIFIFGTIGTLIISIVTEFLSTLLNPLLQRLFIIKSCNPKSNWKNVLFYPVEKIAIKTIQDNIDEFIEHLYLKSLSNPQPKEVIERVDTYYERLKMYLVNIKDFQHFFILSYQNTITQEQRAIDNFEWDIINIRTLLINLILGEIILFKEGYITSLIIFSILALLTYMIFVPQIIKCKRKHISYIIGLSGSMFIIAENADIVDRDSI